MPGAWLVMVGRWITRQDTFERIVAPAIADMQLEASRGMLRRWCHYFAIAVVLIYSVLQDLQHDVSFAFDAGARRVAWKRAAVWYCAFVAAATWAGLRYDWPQAIVTVSTWPVALTSAGLEALAVGFSFAAVPAVLYLCRRGGSSRSIVVAVAVLAGFTMIFS